MLATFWDILWAIKGQSLLILFGLLVGAIPLFKDMRKPRSKQKRPLSLSGKIVFVLFVLLFVFTLFVLYHDKKQELDREFALSEKSRQDSISYQTRHQETIVKIDNLNYAVENARKSDSLFRVALKRGNYKYDSINGVIINPKNNIQNVRDNGKAIQNNAPNYGLQHLGDINLNTARKFDDEGKRELLQRLKGKEKEKISITSVMGDPESFNLATQINNFLIEHKFLTDGIGQAIFEKPVYGLIWDKTKNEIIVGSKPIN